MTAEPHWSPGYLDSSLPYAPAKPHMSTADYCGLVAGVCVVVFGVVYLALLAFT